MVVPCRDTCRHSWIPVVAAALLVGIVAPAAAQNLGVVTGTVVDAREGDELIGAKVQLEKLDAPIDVRTAKTDAEGTFEFAQVRPGRYLLTVSFLGYQERRIPVTFELREARHFDVKLQRSRLSLETAVETPSRRQQRLLEAPASVSVMDPRRIRRESATSSVEALRSVVGVDMAQTGVDRREVALRGFNSAFSAAPYVLTDHRAAAAPALGLNLYSVMPNTALDLDRVEVVRGPAGALYGTGVDGGVLRFVTKDPFQDPGTSLALSGGSRSYLSAQFRQAGVLGGKVGYKFTGQWGRADEWALDPDNPQDAAELGRYRVYEDQDDVPVGREVSEVDRDGDGTPDAFRLRREDLYRRYNVNGLLEYRFDHNTFLSLRGGYASIKSPIQSPIGSLQASDFAYGYGQFRLETGAFSAHVALTRDLPESDVYRLRTGTSVTDEGTQIDGRLQYTFGINALDTEVLVGGEADGTFLQSAAGPGPDEDQFSTVGTYVQTTTPLASSLSLTLAGRADYLSVREDIEFSPRVALVFTPTSQHVLRASYNRTVSVPSASPLLRVVPAAPTPPQATVTQTLEAGYKGQVANRLRLNVDGYYETRDHVLVPVGSPVQYQSGGDIEYWGLDAAVELNATDVLTLFGNTSVVSDDSFDGDNTEDIALNAPALKLKGGLDYELPRLNASIGATAHYVDDFPVRFGPYTGTVDAYTLLDVRARATVPAVPGLSVNVTAKNVLGNDHREFVGAPALGRMIIARLTYTL